MKDAAYFENIKGKTLPFKALGGMTKEQIEKELAALDA